MNLRLGSVPFQFPRAKGLCLTLPPEITGPSITPACSELHLHLTLIFSLLSVSLSLSWCFLRRCKAKEDRSTSRALASGVTLPSTSSSFCFHSSFRDRGRSFSSHHIGVPAKLIVSDWRFPCNASSIRQLFRQQPLQLAVHLIQLWKGRYHLQGAHNQT